MKSIACKLFVLILATSGAVQYIQPAKAQLDVTMFRSANGTKVYQVLQRRDANGLSFGVDEVVITSFAASTTTMTKACLIVPRPDGGFAAEAWSTTDIGTSIPPSAIRKSAIVSDARIAPFDPAANGGAGAVCIGGGCDFANGGCEVPENCEIFTFSDGTPIMMPTMDVPPAYLVEPLTIESSTQCAAENRASYVFDSISAPMIAADICSDVSFVPGALTLSNGSSTLNGVDGTTIVLAYDISPGTFFSWAVSGFARGINTTLCGDDSRRVLTSFAKTTVFPLLTPPPTPTPAPCVGDCDGDGSVSIAELIRGVGVALGNAAVGDCVLLDRNSDDSVSIDELIEAVKNALRGCRSA